MPRNVAAHIVPILLLSASHLATAAETQPFGDSPAQIPGIVEAENYDRGPAEVAYHDVDEENLGADYREETQVDIEARPDASGKHGVGWTRTGEWIVYTVDVRESGTYSLEIPVASNKQGGVFHIEFDGRDVTGPIRVPDTGGWQKLKTITHKDVKLSAGRAQMKLVMDRQGPSGSIGDIDYVRFRRQADNP